MKTGIIYKYTNKKNGKVYVGQTTNENKRKTNHKSSAFNPKAKGYNCHFYRAIRKYGWDTFKYELIVKDYINVLHDLEIKYISIECSLSKGYNETKGGKVTMGILCSEKTKQLISNSMKGRPSVLKGKTLPERIKKLMSIKAKTRVGVNHNRYDDTLYSFRNKETGEKVIKTKYQMGLDYNCQKNIHSVVLGKRKCANKWYLINTKEILPDIDFRGSVTDLPREQE